MRTAIAVILALLAVGSAKVPALVAPADLHDGFAVAAPEAVGIDPKMLEAMTAAIARGEYPLTTSVLIVRDGKLAFEAYFGAGNRSLLNNTRSATKFFAALAVGTAIRDGAIPSADVRAFSYLADLEPFKNDSLLKQKITLKDMMTMSSALDCDDNDDGSPGNEDKMHNEQNWSRWAADLPTMQSYTRDSSGLGPWRYCTANAFLVGQVIQRATHTSADRYIDKNILQPLDIDRRNWSYSPVHETMTGGGLELRSRDLAKIAWMIVADGRWRGRTVIQKSWIDKALTAYRASRPDQNYGYFIFESQYRTACGMHPVWYMAGNGGSQIVLLRDMRTAIVVTRQAYNVHGSSIQTQDLLERYVLPALPCAAVH